MRISTLFLIIILMIMFAGQTLYEARQEENITFNIYNFTETNLIWNYTNSREQIRINFSEKTGVDYGKIQSKRTSNLIHKTVDWYGYTIFEISKWGMEFGYTHPEYDFEFFMKLVLYYLYISLAIVAFPIIIPLCALIYLIIRGVIQLIVKLLKYTQKEIKRKNDKTK